MLSCVIMIYYATVEKTALIYMYIHTYSHVAADVANFLSGSTYPSHI